MHINFKDTEDSKTYLVGDPHLGHQRDFVYGPRGFADVKEHDDGIIQSINDRVRPNDRLIVVGDICLNTTLEQFDAYLERINCLNIYAIWGNHNNPHEKRIYFPGQPKTLVRGIPMWTYPFEYKKLVFLPHYVEAVLNNQFVVLSHYPHFIWNEMSHGAWMVCGHSHYGCEFSKAENLNAKILDVGWDGHLGPWSFDEIKAVMDKKSVPVVDHHR